jgi:hypothetical protein
MQIELAQRDLVNFKPGSVEALKKQTEIEGFKENKKKKSEEYEEALKQSERRACFGGLASNSEVKK